jgi:hypothetical protein
MAPSHGFAAPSLRGGRTIRVWSSRLPRHETGNAILDALLAGEAVRVSGLGIFDVAARPGFELLVPQTPDARRGISVMLVFDARLGLIRRATVLSLQGGHTLSGKAGQLQA